MRIVILYNSSWYVFLLRRNLIDSLLRARHEVTIVAPVDDYTQRVQKMGVEFAPIKMSAVGTSPVQELQTLREIQIVLNRLNPDVVLSFTAKCNLYAGLCRRFMRFRHVANVSGLGQSYDGQSWITYGIDFLYRTAFARTELVFFQNYEDRDRMISSRIVTEERAAVVPGSGVDLAKFTPLSKPPGIRARSFLIFGRLLPKKGFYDFMHAAAELRRRYGEDVVFWILGSVDSERRESQDLLKKIMAAHARGEVRYLNSTDDPLPFIREADVVVLPSTYNEGVPRSLLEALACGKPIVTTNWKGCRDTVEHGRNGFLVPPGNRRALIETLEALVRCDINQLAEYGRFSREIAEKRFDEKLVIRAYHRSLIPESGYNSHHNVEHLGYDQRQELHLQ